MFKNKTYGEVRVGARDGYNRIVSPHVRLFPHNNSENPSYSLPSTIRCSFAEGSCIYKNGCNNIVNAVAVKCTLYLARPRSVFEINTTLF